MNSNPTIIAVSKNDKHSFSKFNCDQIFLIEGRGVEGDAHCSETVQHLSRIKKNPLQPNLRQVHLIHNELHQELKEKGFDVLPGELGENITTSGIDLLSLPQNTILKIGSASEILLTGLRNPCAQIDNFKEGLMKAVLDKDEEGNLIRKSGVMAIVLKSGVIKVGDEIKIALPAEPHSALEPV